MATINRERTTDAPPPKPKPNVTIAQGGGAANNESAQQSAQLTALLAWLFVGFIILLTVVLVTIGGR